MREEYLVALVMFAVLIIGQIVTKNEKKWAAVFLLLASVAGSLAAGMGIRFREIVEGPFGFLDAALSVACAAVFTGLLYRTGFFGKLLEKILQVKSAALKAILLMLFIALPGMFTGLASLSVFTTGKLVGEKLKAQDVSHGKIAPIVMGGAFLGMMLPPNCLPAIIAANGAGSVLPTPYVGFFMPLLVMALPSLIVFALLNKKTLGSCGKDAELLPAAADETVPVQADHTLPVSFGEDVTVPVPGEKPAGKLPLFETVVFGLVCAALLVEGLLTSFVYIGGNTLWFFLGALLLVFVKGSGVSAAVDSLFDAVVPLALLFTLGSFVEVSSMTGVRGIYSLITLPQTTGGQTTLVMLVLMAIGIAVSFFLSVPIPAFLVTYAVFPIGWLANPVIVTGISVAAGLAYLFAIRGGLFTETARTLELKDVKWGESLKALWLPALIMLVIALVFVLYGDPLDFLIM